MQHGEDGILTCLNISTVEHRLTVLGFIPLWNTDTVENTEDHRYDRSKTQL